MTIQINEQFPKGPVSAFILACTTTIALLLFAYGGSANSVNAESDDQRLIIAETFIDAFYSFAPDLLQVVLSSAEDSMPSILFYQGWAEGGNYEVVQRPPCYLENDETVSCSITVKDDLMQALGIDFNVTDTFRLAFSGDHIISVTTSSNDLPIFYDAQEWVKENRPELIAGPCRGFFDGGPTPGDCVRAMVQGYREFAEKVPPAAGSGVTD